MTLKEKVLSFTQLLFDAEVDEQFLNVIYCCTLETVQDFLIKLDIKPLMHLLEISIFSLNNDLVRLTKIMNNLVKDLKILSFKVIFKCLKLFESFQKQNRRYSDPKACSD